MTSRTPRDDLRDMAMLILLRYDQLRGKGESAPELEALRAVLGGKPIPFPAEKRERVEFYRTAMKDPKNHGALALELAFLRTQVEAAAAAATEDGAPVAQVEAWPNDRTPLAIIPLVDWSELPEGTRLYTSAQRSGEST